MSCHPSNNKEVVFILVKPGIYKEKIVVPADKPFITISGSKANGTVITWNDSGNIFESPTFSVLASDFVARYLTIQKSHGAGAKAVALRVSGDRLLSSEVGSYPTTLLDDTGRHYYSNCYIEGAVDFICGNAASLFERCHLHSISEEDAAIAAQRIQRTQASLSWVARSLGSGLLCWEVHGVLIPGSLLLSPIYLM
ncbi:hypothetical protein PTKIN_Ptkin19aG0069400 [Pterospermum kingtungense]